MLSNSAAAFQLSSGLLGWVDKTSSNGTVTSQAINAWDGTNVTTVSNQLKTVFFGSSGGYIFFEEGGKLYAWSPSAGRQLVFDAAPSQVSLGKPSTSPTAPVRWSMELRSPSRGFGDHGHGAHQRRVAI